MRMSAKMLLESVSRMFPSSTQRTLSSSSSTVWLEGELNARPTCPWVRGTSLLSSATFVSLSYADLSG